MPLLDAPFQTMIEILKKPFLFKISNSPRGNDCKLFNLPIVYIQDLSLGKERGCLILGLSEKSNDIKLEFQGMSRRMWNYLKTHCVYSGYQKDISAMLPIKGINLELSGPLLQLLRLQLLQLTTATTYLCDYDYNHFYLQLLSGNFKEYVEQKPKRIMCMLVVKRAHQEYHRNSSGY